MTKLYWFFLVCSLFGCKTSSSNLSGFESNNNFLAHDNQLFLVGSDSRSLQMECKDLVEYRKIHDSMNSQDSALPWTCELVEDSRAIIESGIYPGYTYRDYITMDKIRKSMKFAINVSKIIPAEIWTHVQDIPRDGVCYNSALVDSALLSSSERSTAIQNVGFLLGFNACSFRKTRNKWRVDFGKMSNSPAVIKRFAVEFRHSNKSKAKLKMNAILENDFSPGSILCVDREPIQHIHEAKSEYSGVPEVVLGDSFQNLSKNDQRYSEKQGGHCLTFMTRNLIADSNRMLPYNLTNWQYVFEGLSDHLSDSDDSDETVALYYFKLNPDRSKFRKWFEEVLSRNAKVAKLVEIAREHRSFYEGLEVSQCKNTEQIRLYSADCMQTNPHLKNALVNFWGKVAMPKLRSPIFDDYWGALTKDQVQGLNGSDELGFDIFSELLWFPEALGLIELSD